MLAKNRELEKEVRDVSNWRNAAVEQIKEARGSIKEENVERYIFGLLRNSNSFKTNENPGMNLKSVLEGIGDERFAVAFQNHVEPTLSQITDAVNQNHSQLDETTQKTTQIENLIFQLRGAYQNLHLTSEENKNQVGELKIQTRDELDTFVYNIYNLLFAQSQDNPTAYQLQDQLARYGRLFKRLQELSGDSLTQGTLQQFAEVTEKLRFKLEKAHQESQAESVAPEKLPYLDESRKGDALQILDEYRRKLRGETAQAQALTKELSGAVLDFQRPLQTLLAGATFLDVDNPARNRSHEQLLAQVKAIFAEAGVEIYHPQKGEMLDSARATHDFADGQRHPSPFCSATRSSR